MKRVGAKVDQASADAEWLVDASKAVSHRITEEEREAHRELRMVIDRCQALGRKIQEFEDKQVRARPTGPVGRRLGTRMKGRSTVCRFGWWWGPGERV
jgi:hypothetical protein